MPPKTVKHILLDALDELNDEQLRRFCDRLLDRQAEPRVKRSKIQKPDQINVTDVMVSVFTEKRVIPVAVEILRECKYNDVADSLEEDMARTSAGAPKVRSMADDRHFVDKHQPALIERVTIIGPILDQLLHEKVICQESYNIIMSKPTPQDRMRELFHGALMSSGTKGKDVFLQILEEKDKYLFDDLKEK